MSVPYIRDIANEEHYNSALSYVANFVQNHSNDRIPDSFCSNA